MKRYQNMLVALNLTKMDKPVIQYASIIGNMAHSKNIFFAYVNRGLHIPKEIMTQYPQLTPLTVFSESSMKNTAVDEYNNQSGEILHFDALEGDPAKELLVQLVEKDIDLVVLGRKTESRGTRMLPLKITRKATCSVLIVPEKSTPTINRIMVPLDFSKNSRKAMKVAIAIASITPVASIQCLHVYELPIGYSKTGKTEKEFTAIMEENAVKMYEMFIKKIDLKGVKVSINYVLHKKPAVAIKKEIKNENTDIIIVGARGLSEGAGVLLGSVTEELILTTQIPIMAVKKKGQGIKFLEAFFKYL